MGVESRAMVIVTATLVAFGLSVLYSASAIVAMREGTLLGEAGGAARLKRRMVERVLEVCEAERAPASAPLLTLLRRFTVEAAREEARLFCDDLVAEACIIQADRADAQLVAA